MNTGKLSNYGFDIPIFLCEYILHENGLRIDSNRLGNILICFKEM